jgi:hypothetical protein
MLKVFVMVSIKIEVINSNCENCVGEYMEDVGIGVFLKYSPGILLYV